MSTTAPRPRPPIPHRAVRTRRIAFEYPAERLPRHFVGDDLVMSHIVAVLSSFFPEGEDFFVRTVRNYRDQITDPELKAQVAGFIGQEVTHGREHRHFNERLGTLGYPTRLIDRWTKQGLGLYERILPKEYQLAITAALEHYTATLAEVLLTDPEAQALFSTDEVRAMFQWHALEESEHKSVAFDVYQTVSGDAAVRVWVMRFVTFGFLTSAIGGPSCHCCWTGRPTTRPGWPAACAGCPTRRGSSGGSSASCGTTTGATSTRTTTTPPRWSRSGSTASSRTAARWRTG